ncbi:MAG: hypothetical protein NC095_11685 [Muribaculum sp.]|nr:hypothetical protein [Muribaculum sp.]
MIISLTIACPVATYAEATTVDAGLAIAVGAQVEAIKDSDKKRRKLREATLVAQGAITVALEEVHRVEDTMLDYMKNASGVLSNLIQLKNIAEYAVQLPIRLYNLIGSIPNNPKGAAITAVVSKRVPQTIADITSLASLVTDVVNTTYSFGDENKSPDKKHVNLLSSAERYNILMDVEMKLSKINRDLRLLEYYIQTLSWKDLWMGLDYRSYVTAWNMKWEVNSIKRKWDKLLK